MMMNNGNRLAFVLWLVVAACGSPAEPSFRPEALSSSPARVDLGHSPPPIEPLPAVLAPQDLTTAFRGEPEVVVMTERMSEEEVAELTRAITLRTLDSSRSVPVDVEYIAPDIEAGLRDHRFVVHTPALEEQWYVLEVTESPAAMLAIENRRAISRASGRFRVGSAPVVRRVSFAAADDEVGVILDLSERVMDERAVSEFLEVWVAGNRVECVERVAGERGAHGFDAMDLRCPWFDVDQDVTLRFSSDVVTALGTVLTVGPLGRDGEIRVNPVRGGLTEDDTAFLAPPVHVDHPRSPRKS